MKNINKLAMACGLMISTTSAYASDGQVNFTGSVTSSTCTPMMLSQGNVTLPVVQIPALDGGKTAGHTPFFIIPSSCTDRDANLKLVNVYFEAGLGVDPYTGYIKNTGDAANVKIIIYNDQMQQIAAGDPYQAESESANITGLDNSIAPGNNAAILRYYAAYINDGGTPTAGSVNGSVTFSFEYK